MRWMRCPGIRCRSRTRSPTAAMGGSPPAPSRCCPHQKICRSRTSSKSCSSSGTSLTCTATRSRRWPRSAWPAPPLSRSAQPAWPGTYASNGQLSHFTGCATPSTKRTNRRSEPGPGRESWLLCVTWRSAPFVFSGAPMSPKLPGGPAGPWTGHSPSSASHHDLETTVCWSWRAHPELYSGKHKTTGMNVQVACTITGCLAWISDPIAGSRHDNHCLGESGVLLSGNPRNWLGDKGYIGNNMITPFRKPEGGELLDWQKEFNKQVNMIRYVIEQVIANFKTWRIMHTDYRRPLATFPETISAVVALHFYATA